MATAPTTLTSEKISIGEKIGYGLGDTASNLIWRCLMVFLPSFYTDVFGMSAAAVGTLLLVARFGDGISDFFMGLLADRTETRWGKFRPWILWTILPLGVLTVLTFTTPDLSPTGKLIWAYVTYNLLMMAYTASNIPYSALTGVITGNPIERTSLSSYRFVCAFLGGLILQGLSLYMVQWLGGGDQVQGYKLTMTVFALMAMALFVVTFLTVRERIRPSAQQQTAVKDDIKDLFRNRAWVVLFFVGILFVTFTTLKQGVTLYYFKYYVTGGQLFGRTLDGTALPSLFMVAGLLAAMLGTSLTRPLVQRLGKKTTMNASIAVAMISSALLYLGGPTDIAWIFTLSTLTELSTGPIVTLFFAMLGDAADYSEWKNGRRATGIVFSAGTLSMKFGTGVAGAMTGWLLTVFGYVANVQQTPEALHGIRMLISLFPAVAALLLLVAFAFYTLDEPTLARIETELRARRTREA